MPYDLIIIGGGPAGVTAGIYSARQKLNTLLITKNIGGQLAKKAIAIENYPGFAKISGLDLIKKFEQHLRKQEIEIKTDEVTKLKKASDSFLVFTKGGNKLEAKAVIIASGADPRPLEAPGEKEFLGRGVSYCTICDGAVFSNKEVAVIGGGNSGFEAAIFLNNIAKKIYILEYGSEVKADKENQKAAKAGGKLEVMTSAVVKKIQGDKFVHSIVYKDRESGQEKTLQVEGVFIEIGLCPATSFVKDLVDFNERDEIVVESESLKTKTPGLFAAGDVNVGGFKQIVTACGEGAKAALAAYSYLKKQKVVLQYK